MSGDDPAVPPTPSASSPELTLAPLDTGGVPPPPPPAPQIGPFPVPDKVAASAPTPPPPPGKVPPAPPHASTPSSGNDEMSGQAGEAAKKLDSALEKNHSQLNDADVQLTDAILSASASDDQGKGELDGLKQSIIDEVHRIGPDAVGTRAGMSELAEFLKGKTSDIVRVAHSQHVDSDSKSKVLDALAARFDALDKTGQGGPSDPAGPAANGAPPAGGPGAPGGPAGSGAPGGGVAGDPGVLGNDPLLSGPLPSDGLLGGLPGALGPALGSAAGIPAALGSAIPGLGGGGLGGLGDSLGSALRESRGSERGDEHSSDLKDQHGGPDTKGGAQGSNNAPGTLADQHQNQGNGAVGGQQQTAPAAGPGQPPVGPPAPDPNVDVKGLGPVKVDNAALATASRQVLAGGNLHDEYNKNNIAVPPPGTPVDAPVSPGKTVFGDVGQYMGKQIMALGNQKAWIDGQGAVDFDKIDFGTDFLGWLHPTLPTAPTAAAIPVAAAPTAAPAPTLAAGLPGTAS